MNAGPETASQAPRCDNTQPIDDASYEYPARTKYDDAKVKRLQRRYREQRPTRHRAEMRMLWRAFTFVPQSHRILDVPCGWGRLTVELARKGYEVTGADLSEAMLTAARETLARDHMSCRLECQDVEHLIYPDRSFDTVVCFRLFHHLPYYELRKRVVRELCRVADRFVLISYLSPLSVTAFRRSLRARVLRRKIVRYHTPLAELSTYFREAGFRQLKDFPRLRYLGSLHLAVFERACDGARQS
ncbi:MAG: class I SAM-dependent methyltransferase [Acidiferrobacterales bacterium]